MPRAYTTQFIASAGAGGSAVYTVPAGMRAVIKDLHCVGTTATAGSAIFYLGTIAVWNSGSLASNAAAHMATHLVAHSGTTFQFNRAGGALTTLASGYLFEDSGP